MSGSSRNLTNSHFGWWGFLCCALALLGLGQAEATVRYELYKGNLYVVGPVTGTAGVDYFVNGGNDFDDNRPYGMQQYLKNLITLSQNKTGSPATSAQIYYPLNSYTLCDRGNNSASSACVNQYEGYVGYTAVYLPDAGTYNFSIIANDAAKIDYHVLIPSEIISSNLDYKGLSYSDTSGMMRLDGGGNDGTSSMSGAPTQNGTPSYSNKSYSYLAGSAQFFSYTATGPTYIMLRMYWDNWGNTTNFLIGWQQPGQSNYANIPANNLCDPSAPAKDCFPDLAIKKTSSATYIKPSTDTEKVYLDYTLNVFINPAPNGIAATYGTTTVTDDLPSNLSWDSGSSITAPTGWSCSTGQTINCTTSNILTAGQTYTITINHLLVAQAAAVGQSIDNTAKVGNPNESQAVITNNTDSVSNKIISSTLEKTVNNLSTGEGPKTTATVLPGQDLQYCITGKNTGGINLANYTIRDYVPAASKNIRAITFKVNATQVEGSLYDSGKTINPQSGHAANGLITSASTTLTPGDSAILCFTITVP